MFVIACSAIRNLTVPAAALAFGGCALALFTWPGHVPSFRPSPADAPTNVAEAMPRRDVRQIAVAPSMPPAARPASMLETETALEPIRPVAPMSTASVGIAERPLAKPTVTVPIRIAPGKRTAESRPSRIERSIARASAKAPVRLADADEDQGLVARTFGVGSTAATLVVGGVKGARDTAFGFGRTVVSLVEDTF